MPSVILKPEPKRLTRWWIGFWYNNVTRVVMVLLGGHLLLWVPWLVVIGLDAETIRKLATLGYLTVVVWAILDNDYTNLRRIGLDEFSVRYCDNSIIYPSLIGQDDEYCLSRRWEMTIEGVDYNTLELIVNELKKTPEFKGKKLSVYSES